MDFDTLDRRMRGFEQSLDRTMLQGVYIHGGDATSFDGLWIPYHLRIYPE